MHKDMTSQYLEDHRIETAIDSQLYINMNLMTIQGQYKKDCIYKLTN